MKSTRNFSVMLVTNRQARIKALTPPNRQLINDKDVDNIDKDLYRNNNNNINNNNNREITFLFQRLSMTLQRKNAVSFHNTMVIE